MFGKYAHFGVLLAKLKQLNVILKKDAQRIVLLRLSAPSSVAKDLFVSGNESYLLGSFVSRFWRLEMALHRKSTPHDGIRWIVSDPFYENDRHGLLLNLTNGTVCVKLDDLDDWN
jgi:hypothetical protein